MGCPDGGAGDAVLGPAGLGLWSVDSALGEGAMSVVPPPRGSEGPVGGPASHTPGWGVWFSMIRNSNKGTSLAQCYRRFLSTVWMVGG